MSVRLSPVFVGDPAQEQEAGCRGEVGVGVGAFVCVASGV